MNDNQNLTTGNVSRKLTAFALPLLAANLLQSFYSIVDMLVVGRIVGETGLAAISNASMISFIINSVCIGITMGGTVLAAQYKGAKDENGQIETIGTLFTLAFLTAGVVTVLSIFTYKPLFKVLKVPAAAMEDACGYMKIICGGTIFVFGYNAVCSILKGLGDSDSKSPLYFAAIATAVNTTLLKLIMGILSPDGGIIHFHPKTDVAYYAQELEQLDLQKTVLENAWADGYTVKQLRSVLSNFLFYADDIHKKAEVLSPGEKARLALCKVLLQKANFLIPAIIPGL